MNWFYKTPSYCCWNAPFRWNFSGPKESFSWGLLFHFWWVKVELIAIVAFSNIKEYRLDQQGNNYYLFYLFLFIWGYLICYKRWIIDLLTGRYNENMWHMEIDLYHIGIGIGQSFMISESILGIFYRNIKNIIMIYCIGNIIMIVPDIILYISY